MQPFYEALEKGNLSSVEDWSTLGLGNGRFCYDSDVAAVERVWMRILRPAHPLGTRAPRVAAHFLYAERKDWEFAVLGEIRAVDCGTASRCRAHRGSRRGGPDIVEEGQGGIVNDTCFALSVSISEIGCLPRRVKSEDGRQSEVGYHHQGSGSACHREFGPAITRPAPPCRS